MFKTYYEMTKPGIIYGNAITAIAGFLLASNGNIDYLKLIMVVIGISLVIGAACVFNNYLDKDIDSLMERTKKRAMVEGRVPGKNALIFGFVLAAIGFILIGIFANYLVFIIGYIAIFDYVVLYGIAKRKSVYGTLVGSIAGAVPIVAGYCAVTGQFNTTALILFLILATWQMPHFYSIAMYRYKDYKAAKLPVLPVKSGMKVTKFQILLYIVAFILATMALRIHGYTGNVYLIVMLVLGLGWLYMGVKGLNTLKDGVWARKMFFYSLIVLLSFSILISINNFIT